MNPDLSYRQSYLVLLSLYVPISLSNVWLSYQGWTLTSTTSSLILWNYPFTYLYRCRTCDCRTRDEPWPQPQAALSCGTIPLRTNIVVELVTVVPGMNLDLSHRQPYLVILSLYVPISLSNVWLSYQGWTLTSATGSLILWYFPFTYLYRSRTCDCRTRDEPWPQPQAALSCETIPLRTNIVVELVTVVPGMNLALSHRQPYLVILSLYVPISLSNVWLSYQIWTLTSTTSSLILWNYPFTYQYRCRTCDCPTRDEPWPQTQAALSCDTVPLRTYIVVECVTVVPGMNLDLSHRQPYLVILPPYVPISLSNVWLSYKGWSLTSATVPPTSEWAV